MKNSFHWAFAFVVFVALALRVAFAIAVDKGLVQAIQNPDSLGYLSCAYNLSTGVGYAQAVHDEQPFSKPVEFSAWRPPLYPAVLAVAMRFSRSMLFLRLLQVTFAGISLCLFLWLAYRLFGEWPALIAGMIFALYPPLILYSADIGTEGLFLLLLLAVFAAFYAERAASSAARPLWIGVLIGLCALCRPPGIALIPALAIAILLRDRNLKKSALAVVLVCIGAGLVILPWTYRNYRVFHKFVLISSNGGATLWAGAYLRLVPGATLDEVGYTQHGAHPEMSETERERYYYGQALVILDHDPRRFATMFLRNFEAMYALVPSSVYHSSRNRLLYTASYVPLLVCGLAGFWLLRRRWRDLEVFWGFMVAETALYCIYLSAIRYRVPAIDPILMLGAGVFLAALFGRRGVSGRL